MRGAEGSWDAGAEAAGGDALPWQALGPEVAAKLLPAVETVVEDVLATVVERDVPREWVVGRPNARHGIEHGLRGLLQLVAAGPQGPLPDRGLYVGFGRGQVRAGRSLGALLAAYHHAARAAWRALARTGSGAGLPSETLGALADAILAYLAEISAASAEGFAFEQAARGEGDGEGERRRALVAALVRAPAPPAAELRALAAAAGWRPGPRVAALAFRAEEIERAAARLPADAPCARVDGVGYAIVPDADGPARRAQLRAHLRDVAAGLGPAVALADAAESARWARLALALADGTALVVADERRVDLLLAAAPLLSAGLAEEALAPLAALPSATRERLLATLRSWLANHGSVVATAADLHVHAQTVRYRVGQLRALLGERFDAAEGRLELELALRARSLGAAAGRRRAAEPI
nr:helix-turn-helix domain-containing protein [Conexibacter arvalis]